MPQHATDIPATLVIVGETVVDRVVHNDGSVSESVGGSPANVAVTLGRLGRHPQLWTSLGADDSGSFVRQWLTSSGVDIVVVGPPDSSTATASAFLEQDGSAHYEFEIDWDVVVTPEIDAAVVHVGSVSSLLEPGADVVLQIVQSSRARSTITFDPNIRPALISDPNFARDRVETLVACSDIVKASDADIGWLYPGANADDVGRDWLSRGAALVVITLGAHGAVAFAASGRVECDAVETEVVDTIGAGDTFMGTLIDGLVEANLCGEHHRDELRGIRADTVRELLRRCVMSSAVTVSRAGANPPWRSELEAQNGGERDRGNAKASQP